MRPFERVGLERDAQGVRLEQQRQAGHGPLLARRRRKAAERGPHRILDFGRDGHAFVRQQRRDPVRRPAPLGGMVDVGEWLEGEARAIGVRIAERMVCATHRQDRGAGRIAFVEDIDLGTRIAAELERD